MVLMDIGAVAERIEKYRYVIDDGVNFITLPAEEYGLEHKKVGFLYLGFLWLVSLVALVKNLGYAISLKMFVKKGESFHRILWGMGRDKRHVSSFAVDRFSDLCREVKANAANWRALDICYNYLERFKAKDSGLANRLTDFWLGNLMNRQAITNRKKVITNLLVKAFNKFRNEPEVRIVSFASGSAQAVIEAIKECPNINIKAVFIDIDPTALEESKRIAAATGLKGNLTFVRGTPKTLDKVCDDFSPHIIEMVGFLDYLSKEKALRLIQKIERNLPRGGIFITCNIKNNSEKILLDWVFLWPMVYRSKAKLAELLIGGGFSPENVEIIYEPQEIHGIGVCRKSRD